MNNTDEHKSVRQKSVIISTLDRLTKWLLLSLSGGFLGKIFTRYTAENKLLENSFAAGAVGKLSSPLRQIRFAVSEQFETSGLLHWWKRIADFLAGCRLRMYGSFFLTYGIYTALVWAMKRYAIAGLTADNNDIVFSSVLILTSVPLLLTSKTLVNALYTSRSGFFISVKLLGIPEEKLKTPPSKHGDSYNFAIVAGVITGSLTFITGVGYVPLVLLAFLCVALVLTYPEIGVIATVAFIPFVSFAQTSRNALIYPIILFVTGYVLKLIRGRRLIRFGLFDLMLLIIGMTVGFGGLVSANPAASSADAGVLICLLTGCFVAGNLMRTKLWQKRCLMVQTATATAVALAVILQVTYVESAAYLPEFLKLMLPGNKVLSFFGNNAHMLASYLIISLPLAASCISHIRGSRHRLYMRLLCLLIIAAIVITGSSSGIVGALIALLLYYLVTGRRSVGALISLCFFGACALLLIRDTPVASFLPQYKSFIESYYPVSSIWQGALAMVSATAFGGAGIGGFSELYPRYAAPGFESVTDSSALWIGILGSLGIVGLIFFAITLFVFLQNCFEYLKKPFSLTSQSGVAAGMCAIIGVLAQSLFCDLFCDTTMFFALFCLMTLVCAAIRNGRNENERTNTLDVNSETAASVDI